MAAFWNKSNESQHPDSNVESTNENLENGLLFRTKEYFKSVVSKLTNSEEAQKRSELNRNLRECSDFFFLLKKNNDKAYTFSKKIKARGEIKRNPVVISVEQCFMRYKDGISKKDYAKINKPGSNEQVMIRAAFEYIRAILKTDLYDDAPLLEDVDVFNDNTHVLTRSSVDDAVEAIYLAKFKTEVKALLGVYDNMHPHLRDQVGKVSVKVGSGNARLHRLIKMNRGKDLNHSIQKEFELPGPYAETFVALRDALRATGNIDYNTTKAIDALAYRFKLYITLQKDDSTPSAADTSEPERDAKKEFASRENVPMYQTQQSIQHLLSTVSSLSTADKDRINASTVCLADGERVPLVELLELIKKQKNNIHISLDEDNDILRALYAVREISKAYKLDTDTHDLDSLLDGKPQINPLLELDRLSNEGKDDQGSSTPNSDPINDNNHLSDSSPFMEDIATSNAADEYEHETIATELDTTEIESFELLREAYDEYRSTIGHILQYNLEIVDLDEFVIWGEKKLSNKDATVQKEFSNFIEAYNLGDLREYYAYLGAYSLEGIDIPKIKECSKNITLLSNMILSGIQGDFKDVTHTPKVDGAGSKVDDVEEAMAHLEHMDVSELKSSLNKMLETINEHLNDDEQNLLNSLWVQCDTAGSGFMDVLNWLSRIDIVEEDIEDQKSDVNVAISCVIDVAYSLRSSDLGLPIDSIIGFPDSRYVSTLASEEIDRVISAIIELSTQSTCPSEDSEAKNIPENTESTDHEHSNVPEDAHNAVNQDENNNIKHFEGIAKGITTSIEDSIDRIVDIDDKEGFFITFGIEFARRLRESFEKEAISVEVLNIILSSIVKTTQVMKDGLTANSTTVSKQAIEITIRKVKALDGHMARAGALSMALYADVLADLVSKHESNAESTMAPITKEETSKTSTIPEMDNGYGEEEYYLDLELVDKVKSSGGAQSITDVVQRRNAKKRIKQYEDFLETWEVVESKKTQNESTSNTAEDGGVEVYADEVELSEEQKQAIEKERIKQENVLRRERIKRDNEALEKNRKRKDLLEEKGDVDSNNDELVEEREVELSKAEEEQDALYAPMVQRIEAEYKRQQEQEEEAARERRIMARRERVISAKKQERRKLLQNTYNVELAKIDDQSQREKYIRSQRRQAKLEKSRKIKAAEQERLDKIRDEQSLKDVENMIKDLNKEIAEEKAKHQKDVKSKKHGHK